MSQSPVSPTEDFEKMLDEFESIVTSDRNTRLTLYNAARSALLSRFCETEARVYAELQQEIYRHVNARTKALAEAASLRLELSEARERQLTAEEAMGLVADLMRGHLTTEEAEFIRDKPPRVVQAWWDSGVAKLRASLPTPTSDVK